MWLCVEINSILLDLEHKVCLHIRWCRHWMCVVNSVVYCWGYLRGLSSDSDFLNCFWVIRFLNRNDLVSNISIIVSLLSVLNRLSRYGLIATIGTFSWLYCATIFPSHTINWSSLVNLMMYEGLTNLCFVTSVVSTSILFVKVDEVGVDRCIRYYFSTVEW